MSNLLPYILGIGGIIIIWQSFILYKNRHMIKPTAAMIAYKVGIDPMKVYGGLAPLTQEEKEKLRKLNPFKRRKKRPGE